MSGTLGMIGGQLLSQAGQYGIQNMRDSQAMRNQKTLNNQQFRHQQALNEQGKELALQQWKDTNYEAQRREMEKAGLNPGLMYGMGGGGGTTANAGSGGSAQGGSAPAPQQMKVGLDIAEISQVRLLDAQAKKLEAETKKLNEDAGRTHEEGRGQFLDNIIKEYGMSGTPEKDEIVQHEHYGNASLMTNSATARTIQAGANMTEQQVDNAEQQLKNMQADEQKSLMETVSMKVNNELTELKKTLTSEQTRQIYHEIIVSYINAGMKGLDTIIKAVTGRSIAKAITPGQKKGYNWE